MQKANLGSHDLMRYKACIKQDWVYNGTVSQGCTH